MSFKSHLNCTHCHIVGHISVCERLSLGDVRAIAKNDETRLPRRRPFELWQFANDLQIVCRVILHAGRYFDSFCFHFIFPFSFFSFYFYCCRCCWRCLPVEWTEIWFLFLICLGKTGQYWFPLLTVDCGPYNFPSFIQLTNSAHLNHCKSIHI